MDGMGRSQGRLWDSAQGILSGSRAVLVVDNKPARWFVIREARLLLLAEFCGVGVICHAHLATLQ